MLQRHEKTLPSGKRTHWYTYYGEKLTSVTTILDKVLPKPALVFWASKIIAEHVTKHHEQLPYWYDDMGEDNLIKYLKNLPLQVRDEAAMRGTKVHSIAEEKFQGTESVTASAHSELGAYAAGVDDFIRDYQPEVILTETTVAHTTHRYAGQFDLLAKIGDDIAMIDVKTSKNVYSSTALQLAAYANADIYIDDDGVQKNFDFPITAAYILHLTGDPFESYNLVKVRDFSTSPTSHDIDYMEEWTKILGMHDMMADMDHWLDK